jgi:hypothetical protein
MTEPTQLDLLAQARKRRDRGLERVLTHAENVLTGWNMAADQVLDEYLVSIAGGTFLAEQFRQYAECKVGAPPDARAWGGPIRRAAIAGRIERVGWGMAASSNNSPKALWKAKRRSERCRHGALPDGEYSLETLARALDEACILEAGHEGPHVSVSGK